MEEIFDEEEEEEAAEEPQQEAESSRQDLDTSRLLAAGVSVTIIEKSRYSNSEYSRCPKSERSDFGAFKFGSVAKQFGFRTTSEIRTIWFGFRTFGLFPIYKPNVRFEIFD